MKTPVYFWRTAKTKLVCCFLLSLLAATTACADLGGTLADCQALYGEPVSRKAAAHVEEMVLFEKKEMKIAAGMKAGKCVLLVFGKKTGEPLSDGEMETILKSDSGGSSWKKSSTTSGNMVWNREDNFAVAQFDALHGILTLVTTAYMKEQMAKKN